MRRRVILLLVVMVAALLLASGVAMAANRVCPSGTTQSNPCKGTAKNDTLIGTSGDDYIVGLSGNDHISAGTGNDTTDGGAGNDTYSYKDGWGTDTLVDASGFDTLNFSAVSSGISAYLYSGYGLSPSNVVFGPAGEAVNVSLNPLSVIEKVVGSASGYDDIETGEAANILQPGPGTGGARLTDYGGYSADPQTSIPVSNDTYSGFLASGYGPVSIHDYGGTADKLILPFASTGAYFEASDVDGDGSADTLLIMSTSTDSVTIYGQLAPYYGFQGHIETIQFTDGTFSIGNASATNAGVASSSASPTAQVDQLNAASTLSASKKDELAKAAKKLLSQPQAPPTGPEEIKPPGK